MCPNEVTRSEAASQCSGYNGYYLLQPRQQAEFDLWKTRLDSSKKYWVGAVGLSVLKSYVWENTSIAVPSSYFPNGILGNVEGLLNECVSFERQKILFSSDEVYGFLGGPCSNLKEFVCQKPSGTTTASSISTPSKTVTTTENTSILGENCQEVNSTYWICADQVTRPNASSLCSSKYGYILLQPRQQADFDFWKSDLFSSKSYWIGAIRTDVNERFHWENSSIDVPSDYFRSGSNQDARVNYSCVSFEPTYLGATTASGYALEARQCDIRRGYVCQNPQDAKINMLLNVSTQAINILETTSVTTASESRNISVSDTSSYVTLATKSYVNGMLRTSVSVISGSEATSDVTAVTDSNGNSISVTPPSASIMSVTTSYVTVAQLNVNSMPATRTSANSMLVTPPSANTMLVTPTSDSTMSVTPTSVHSMSVTSSNANTPLELNTSAVTPATTNQNTLTESLTIVSDSRETNASRAGETTIQLLSFRPTETVSSAMSVQPSLQQQFSIYSFPEMPTPSTAPNTTDYAQTSFPLALPTAPQPACLSSCPTTPAYTTDTAATAPVHSTPTSPPYTTKQAVQTSTYPNLCSCRCTHEANPTSLSQISKKEILLDIKNQLHVDVKNASSTIRRLTCAEDKRRSAQILGSIGVIVLVTVLGCILVLDFTRLVQCDSRSQDISVKKHTRKKMTKKALK